MNNTLIPPSLPQFGTRQPPIRPADAPTSTLARYLAMAKKYWPFALLAWSLVFFSWSFSPSLSRWDRDWTALAAEDMEVSRLLSQALIEQSSAQASLDAAKEQVTELRSRRLQIQEKKNNLIRGTDFQLGKK